MDPLHTGMVGLVVAVVVVVVAVIFSVIVVVIGVVVVVVVGVAVVVIGVGVVVVIVGVAVCVVLAAVVVAVVVSGRKRLLLLMDLIIFERILLTSSKFLARRTFEGSFVICSNPLLDTLSPIPMAYILTPLFFHLAAAAGIAAASVASPSVKTSNTLWMFLSSHLALGS